MCCLIQAFNHCYISSQVLTELPHVDELLQQHDDEILLPLSSSSFSVAKDSMLPACLSLTAPAAVSRAWLSAGVQVVNVIVLVCIPVYVISWSHDEFTANVIAAVTVFHCASLLNMIM